MTHPGFLQRCLIAALLVCSSKPLWSADISFEAVDPEQTQLAAIMQESHDRELQRQGGKFQSHGWWPWGLRAFDFDRDGDLDLIASHHGKPGSIIIESHFGSVGKLVFSNATEKLGVGSRDLPGADDRPWIWDINGDGFLDIAGMSDESTAPVFLNKAGQSFELLENASLKPLAHPAEILDLNDDGYPDVDGGYLGRWLFQPDKKQFQHLKEPRFQHFNLVPQSLQEELAKLKEKKNNRFLRSVAMTHMLNGYDTTGYSPDPIDLNADGIGDLVVQTSGGYGADYLGHYLLGASNGTFREASSDLGLPESGAPILIDDLTGDDRPDILIVGKETGGVYVRDGRDSFVRVEGSLTTFLQKRGPYLLRAFRIDADNDGDWDLAMTNPRLGRVEVFENNGDGRFTSLLTARGWDSNSCVVADMNNDGKMDIVVGTRDRRNVASISVFVNQTQATGNFLKVRMKMPSPNPFAVGAVLSATATGERKITHIEKSHWDGTPIHLGLGDAERFHLTATFPGGKTVRVDLNSANREITVDQSRGFLIQREKLPARSAKEK